MSRHVSQRSARNPLGDENRLFVSEANVMTARVVLLAWLCHALHIPFIIEQPGGSLLPTLPRFFNFMRDVCLMAKVGVWLRGLGHTSMKRTLFFANTMKIHDLSIASVCSKERFGLEGCMEYYYRLGGIPRPKHRKALVVCLCIYVSFTLR